MTASLLKQFMTQTEFKSYRGMMHSSSEEVRKFNQKEFFIKLYNQRNCAILAFLYYFFPYFYNLLFLQEMRDMKKFIEKVLKP